MEKPKLVKDLGLRDYGKYRKRIGIFECPQCKKEFTARINAIKSGNTQTCGCIGHGIGNYRHGGKHTRLYDCWLAMRARADGRSSERHKRFYIGISVCDEWLDFKVFREWALSHGYAEDLVIDRIISTGNYSPGNCQWITQSDNAQKAMMKRWHGVEG